MVSQSSTYKNFVSVTAQVFFCAAPIRLDAYNGCQFGCVYCFSKKRSRVFANKGVRQANANAFRKRLERVHEGKIASALDEFLEKRVPIQLGGLHDPFTPREKTHRVTLELLHILDEFQYPTLISTKGVETLSSEYVDVLSRMNTVVRISASGISEDLRDSIDRRCTSFDVTLRKMEELNSAGIVTALRIQPVFPGYESDALRMINDVVSAGAKQVTVEYLKIPKENMRSNLITTSRSFSTDFSGIVDSKQLVQVGPDWVLPTEFKLPFVREARALTKKLGSRFGAGDTELIPLSDGNGCCGSSSLFPGPATQFESNFVGCLKKAIRRGKKTLATKDLDKLWMPAHSVANYLDSRSRPTLYTGWKDMLLDRWNPGPGPYSPRFFWGVKPLTERDSNGFVEYDISELLSESREPNGSSIQP